MSGADGDWVNVRLVGMGDGHGGRRYQWELVVMRPRVRLRASLAFAILQSLSAKTP